MTTALRRMPTRLALKDLELVREVEHQDLAAVYEG
jgi:hypothetical protein